MRMKDVSYFSRLLEISDLLAGGHATPYGKGKASVLIQALANDFGLTFEEVEADAINRSSLSNANAVRQVAQLQPRPKLPAPIDDHRSALKAKPRGLGR